MDAAVGVQFLMYAPPAATAAVLVVEAEGVRGAGRWRRVSGWMRGWVPAAAAAGGGSSSISGPARGTTRRKSKRHYASRDAAKWSVGATDGYGYDSSGTAETDSLLRNVAGGGNSTSRGYGGTGGSR